jgi:hypothetical protein
MQGLVTEKLEKIAVARDDMLMKYSEKGTNLQPSV